MNNLLGPIIGLLFGIPLSYLFFIFQEKYKKPILRYQKIFCLSSLAFRNKKIRDKPILDNKKGMRNSFHFLVRIKNVGKALVSKVPITFQFTDPNIEIISIDSSFDPRDKIKHIDIFKETDRKNQIKVVIKPGLDGGDEGMFHIFTASNKIPDLSTLRVRLGEIQGINWGPIKPKPSMKEEKFLVYLTVVLIAFILGIILAPVLESIAYTLKPK